MIRQLTLSAALFVLAILAAPGCSVDDDALGLIKPTGQRDGAQPAWIDVTGVQQVSEGVRICYWIIRHKSEGGADPYGPPSGGSSDATVGPSSRGTVILLHPLLTSKSWFASLGRILAAAGWDVVLPDLRCHGGSTGDYITWGLRERGDLKQLMDALIVSKNVSDRIYVLGASFGGCVAIQYAAADPRCHGVIALAPPQSFREVARLKLAWLPQSSVDAAVARAGEIARFNPLDASATEAAARLKCPLILVHGKMDMVVPPSQSEGIFQVAHEPKKLIMLPWVDHLTIQAGRNDWLARQVDYLAVMSIQTPQTAPDR